MSSALLTPGGNHNPFPPPPTPTSLINVTHCQTILSLLGLLYPSTVVLPPICMICPCLLIGWSSLKAKTLLFTSICPQPSIYRAHTRCSINGCWIEISSWFPCSTQGEPKLVALRRGGDWEEEHLGSHEPTPWKFPQSPPPSPGYWEPRRSKGLSTGCSGGSKSMSSVHRLLFLILFQALQIKELTVCSLGHWNKMER